MANREAKTSEVASHYREQRQRIEGVLRQLAEALDKHSAMRRGKPGDWDFVADLEHAAGELSEVVAFFHKI